MKKKHKIILGCILCGLLFYGSSLYYKWYQFNLTTSNQTRFITWLISEEGIEYLIDALGDLGIGLIGSAIFLIMVDWTLANTEKRIVDATELKSKRREIVLEMRYSPGKTLQKYRLSENVINLFTDQFFQGCEWHGLRLDGLDFSKSDLSNCDLTNSSLIDTNLSDCVLNGVILKGAKLICTNFKGSDVSDAQLSEADSLWNSIMPNGDRYDGRFMLQGDIKEASRYGYDIINDERARRTFFRKNIDR